MSLLHAIFGAKPPVGTPPFASEPLHTGGANAAPAPGQPRGLSGFIERALNPTSALGQFGQALTAASGGPLGNAMGYMMAQRAAGGTRGQEFEDWRQRYDYETAHPRPSTAQPYRWEGNDGDVYELGPDGQPRRLFDDPTPKMNFIPDGLGGGQWVSVPSAAPGSLVPQPPADGLPAIGSVMPDPRRGGPASAPGGFRVR